MTWATELNIIRRYLRDPDANIWSNDLLAGLFNQAQNELQQRTGFLEDVTAVACPPMFQASYMLDWEYGHIDGDVKYRCFRNQGNNFTFCFRWEAQENFGVGGDTSDEGICYSHPWEAFVGEVPGSPPPFPLPQNANTIKALYQDSIPIPPTTKKAVTSTDPSWVTREGVPLAYYQEDTVSNQFYLIGRPSSLTWADESGDGMVTDVEDHTVASETGIITQVTGGTITGESGVASEAIEDDDNILLIYSITPSDVTGLGDDLDFPSYLGRYIRSRVLQLAYSANTDGRIESLAGYWGKRALLGLKVVKKYLGNRSQDRDFVLRTKDGYPTRNTRHPRLPSGYPAV